MHPWGRSEKEIFQPAGKGERLRTALHNVKEIELLDFFKVKDDGVDLKIFLKTETDVKTLSGDSFADAMDRLNQAGVVLEKVWDSYFERLDKSM